MPDESQCPEHERAETTFYRLLIVRDIWLPGVQRWGREYVGRKLDGELYDAPRCYALEFWESNGGPEKADSERRLAEMYLHHPLATRWRVIRVKVRVRRRLRDGYPKEMDFAPSPGLMSLPQWAGALGDKKRPRPS